MSLHLEACVGNLQEALKAEKLGATQIELCDRLDLDGTSPPLEVIQSVISELKIPVKVIVNPNPYHYTYSEKDIQKILDYIKLLDPLDIAGIVFGPLTSDGRPDLSALHTIASHTNLPITFHKAIDQSKDIFESTSLLADQGIVKFILSSGGKSTAAEGQDNLMKMQTILKGSTLQLIGAGKITHENLETLHHNLNLNYYHGKKIVGDLS